MMQKLLFVGSNSIHCQRYLAGLIETKQFDICVITNTVMENLTGISQYEVNFAMHNLKAAKQIAKIAQNFQPSIIHIQQANSYAWHTLRGIARLKSLQVRTILTCWGSDVLLLPNQSKLMHKVVKYNLTNVDVITADSFHMLSRINQLLNGKEKPSYNINFGINNLPQPVDLMQSKQKYILSNRLHKKLYRVDKIILAFAELVQHQLIDDDYKLLVAGSGSETEYLIDLTKQKNITHRVEFLGMLDYPTLVEYYKKSTIFVSVPESDGTASSLLEAMAYGCIPVLSNLPANLEWVLDKINGIIEPNLQHLSNAIISAIKISQNNCQYQQLHQFNYNLIQEKALFMVNLNKFIQLY